MQKEEENKEERVQLKRYFPYKRYTKKMCDRNNGEGKGKKE